ncbi:carboxylesterase NlhH [mine drainage metagenome]|uniref:Carboxylesterase NlhH n=1 Tax=mine drainage metagenome TaxID=410659 RepID=A0A1J5T2I2_9ZZZZ
MKAKIHAIVILFTVLGAVCPAKAEREIRSDRKWMDTDGRVIQAHGGGILFYAGVYYWYGENKARGAEITGVSCYSSRDLYNWKNEGLVLRASGDSRNDLYVKNVLERPKVIFNPATRKFVMWMHIDHGDYQYARLGVAVADKPTGPFIYLGSKRPLNDSTSRDMNLFVDDDGSAYVIYSAENNSTLYISRLNNDFTDIEQPALEGRTWNRVLINQSREAPALFKSGGRYYLITSGCTGWKANAAEYAIADNPLGPYRNEGNPCRGAKSEITYGAQSTFVLPLAGRPGCFIFMADRWNSRQLGDSRYLWLPLCVKVDGTFTLRENRSWALSDCHPKETYLFPPEQLLKSAEKILYKKTPQEDLYLYLLRPVKRSNGLLPAIVYFTGGGWITGDSKDSLQNAAWFRDLGIVGIAADYRVYSRDHTSPIEAVEDAKSAIRYVRVHAKELGIDPNRIIAAGGSAGGQLAINTFLDGHNEPYEDLNISSKPDALVLHNPVLGIGFGEAFFKEHPECDPLRNVRKGWPPTILSCGTKDDTTPYLGAVTFRNAMLRAGNICELVPVKGAGHSCDWPATNPAFLPTLGKMAAFLRKLGFMPR